MAQTWALFALQLCSRLSEDLYKQIAYTNPREFLNVEAPAPVRSVKKKRTPSAPSGSGGGRLRAV